MRSKTNNGVIFAKGRVGPALVALFVLGAAVAFAQSAEQTEGDVMMAPPMNQTMSTPMNQIMSPALNQAMADESVSAEENMETEAPPVEEASAVELHGDEVSFDMQENKMIADGNVSIKKSNVTLFCDHLEFYRETKVAVAEGNVVLLRDSGRMEGQKMKFNFDTMKGEFQEATYYSEPFFGSGESLEKVGENHIRIIKGRMTTCDLDKPHYHFGAKKVDVYPGDKAVGRNVRLVVGKIPIMFIPKFTQDLSAREPAVQYTPGYSKDWGAFLLTAWRYRVNEYLRGAIHLDYRHKKDLAWGIDADYKTKGYGSGVIRTYYMNERSVNADTFFDERTPPTTEKERFKIEWRHKWDIDPSTQAIGQYYKLSDSTILKDYFEREYEEDANPASYFLLTKGIPSGTLSFRTDVRVNRFEDKVERLPEIIYDMPSHEIFNTGLFFSNKSTYSNLVHKTPAPSEIRQQTMRFDNANEVSYPFKLSIFEIRPYVGGEQTYYSKTKDRTKYDIIRGIFRTGADVNTKFYRVFDVKTDRWGLDINRLRHIITPSVAYFYQNEPTVPSSLLDQFDSIDNRTRQHKITLSLENKLQTKRENKSVDLVRLITSSDFLLKEDAGKGGFNNVKTDLEITPYNWLRLLFEADYDTVNDHLSTANVDFYLRDPKGKWYFNLSKRLNYEVDDLLTTETGYRINQKWKFRVYQRFTLDSGTLKEQEYTLTRDLHAWLMNISFNETRGEGSEIWLVFTLKAFPDLGFDFGTSFNKRKAGTQSGE